MNTKNVNLFDRLFFKLYTKNDPVYTPAVRILFDNHTTMESQYCYVPWDMVAAIHLDF